MVFLVHLIEVIQSRELCAIRFNRSDFLCAFVLWCAWCQIHVSNLSLGKLFRAVWNSVTLTAHCLRISLEYVYWYDCAILLQQNTNAFYAFWFVVKIVLFVAFFTNAFQSEVLTRHDMV